MKINRTLFLIILTAIAVTAHSQTGWIKQASVTDHNLKCVRFTNHLTGWIAGDGGIILNTTNGGSQWNISGNPHPADLQSISVTSESIFVSGDSGYVLRLINGNSEWKLLNTGVNVKLMSVYFTDVNTGFAAGFSGTVIRTTNGGDNWIIINSGTDIQINSIYFANDSVGWAAGYGGIFHTTNGGDSWTPQFIDGLLNLNSIFFSDPLNGWSAYYDNPTFGTENVRTTDGGLSWINYSMDNSYSLDLFFISNHTGWSSCYFGKIMYSSNGGTGWIPQTSGTTENLNSIFFVDSLNGWCAGNNGVILKTISGGIITNAGASSESTEMKFELLQNYPNPFNSQTIIKYHLNESSDVSITLYDIYGREILLESSKSKSPGIHKLKLLSNEFSSGIYYCKIKAGKKSGTIKLVILK